MTAAVFEQRPRMVKTCCQSRGNASRSALICLATTVGVLLHEVHTDVCVQLLFHPLVLSFATPLYEFLRDCIRHNLRHIDRTHPTQSSHNPRLQPQLLLNVTLPQPPLPQHQSLPQQMHIHKLPSLKSLPTYSIRLFISLVLQTLSRL